MALQIQAVTNGLLAKQDPDNDLSTITSSDIGRLKSAGYSIAYKPESKAEYDPDIIETVPQTQGYSDGLLERFRNGDNIQNMKTESVRQVNKGTITTYPYDLNKKGLSEGGLGVSETHMQWYQLNMNSDNIVVWYTLNGSGYSRNDCINNYYLFSCDNIFYTGAGHAYNPKEYEVKLQEIEKERQQIEEDKAETEKYKGLLFKQRDIMNALANKLNERDEIIAQLQEELDACDKQDEINESLTKRVNQLEALLIKKLRVNQKG